MTWIQWQDFMRKWSRKVTRSAQVQGWTIAEEKWCPFWQNVGPKLGYADQGKSGEQKNANKTNC